MLYRFATTFLLLGLLVGGVGPVSAQVPDDSVRAQALRDFHGPDGAGKDGPLRKADLDLLMLYHRHQRADDGDAFAPEQSGLRVRDGHVVVDAIAAEEGAQLRADLERLGMKGSAAAGRVVSGRLPIEQIPAAAQLQSLRGLTASRPRTRTTGTPPSPPAEPAQPPRLSSPTDSTGGGDTSDGAGLLLMGGMLLLLFLEEC